MIWSTIKPWVVVGAVVALVWAGVGLWGSLIRSRSAQDALARQVRAVAIETLGTALGGHVADRCVEAAGVTSWSYLVLTEARIRSMVTCLDEQLGLFHQQ
jgi:hypothetical protein